MFLSLLIFGCGDVQEEGRCTGQTICKNRHAHTHHPLACIRQTREKKAIIKSHKGARQVEELMVGPHLFLQSCPLVPLACAQLSWRSFAQQFCCTHVARPVMVSRCATAVALLAASCPSAVSWTTIPAAASSSGSTRQRQVHASSSSFGAAATRSRGGGVRKLRMGAAEDAIEEEVRAMRASQIKKTLEEMSVATKGVYEVCWVTNYMTMQSMYTRRSFVVCVPQQ